jgi:DNA polymerase-3 subunit delta
MKLTYRDIATFADRRPTQGVILVYGPDRGLVKDRAGQLARHIVPDLNDPFNVSRLTGDQITADPARLMDEASSISMLGGDRVVFIEEAGDSLSVHLKLYLASPVPGTYVVITSDELSPKSPLRKLIETADTAVALPCYVQDARDIQALITQTLRAANLAIERDALVFLSDAIAGDHEQVKSELEKLLTYMGIGPDGKVTPPKTVTLVDATACSGTMGQAAFDTFVDSFLLGDTATAMEQFKRLLDDGIAEIAMIRALLAHGRKLQATHIRMQNGEDLNAILDNKNTAPVFFKRKTAFTAQIRKWPLLRLMAMMNDLLTAEFKMKSGVDPSAAVPQVFLSLAARANKG